MGLGGEPSTEDPDGQRKKTNHTDQASDPCNGRCEPPGIDVRVKRPAILFQRALFQEGGDTDGTLRLIEAIDRRIVLLPQLLDQGRFLDHFQYGGDSASRIASG